MNTLFQTLQLCHALKDKRSFEEAMKIVPDSSQENVRALFDWEILGIDEAILEAQQYLFNEEDEPALEILGDLIDQVEELDPIQEDDNFLYYTLQNAHEIHLFEILEKSGKSVMNPKENFGFLYQTYGAVLLAQERMEEAKECFEKSLKWNPFDLETRLFVIEVLKMENLMEQFYFENKKLMKMAVSSKCISIIYQNFAYYYLQKNDSKSALYSLLMAADYGFDADPYVTNLIEQIDLKQVGKELPTEQEIYAYFIEKGIPVPPDEDLYEYFLERALENEADNIEEAMFCLSVLDEIKNSLEKESDDEIRIRKKYNRKLGNEIHKIQEISMDTGTGYIISKLLLTKVHLPFIHDMSSEKFPCDLVENDEGELFIPMYLFPSKIPQSQKKNFEIRQVPFEFSIRLLEEWDEVAGIVLHPFSKDAFEMRREDFQE